MAAAAAAAAAVAAVGLRCPPLRCTSGSTHLPTMPNVRTQVAEATSRAAPSFFHWNRKLPAECKASFIASETLADCVGSIATVRDTLV